MRPIGGTFRTIAVTMLMLLGLLTAMPAASAQPGDNDGPGNSGAAQQCKHGGWQSLVREDGSGFANQGDCVSYGAQGGVIATPTVEIVGTVEIDGWYRIPNDATRCVVSFSVSGFADGTYEAGIVGLGTFGQPLVVFDGTGSIWGDNVHAGDGRFDVFHKGAELQAFVGSLVSAPSTVRC